MTNRSRTPRTIKTALMMRLGWRNCARVCGRREVGRAGTIYNAIDCFQWPQQLGRVRMLLKFPAFFLLLVTGFARLGAEEALNPPVPFVATGPEPISVGGN